MRPISKQKEGEHYRSAYRVTQRAKTSTTNKRQTNKQGKRHGNSKGTPAEQPKVHKRAQPANVRPRKKQKREEP